MAKMPNRIPVIIEWLDASETTTDKEPPLAHCTSCGFAWRDPENPDAVRISFHDTADGWSTETTHNIKIDAITAIYPLKKGKAISAKQLFKRRKSNASD